MKLWLKISIMIIILVIIYEFIIGYSRQLDRRNIYNQAKLRSENLNKPLLVYGDPYNGQGSKIFNNFLKGYDCGDETIDLTGSPKCKNGVKSDILKHLQSKPSNSAVIFVSCVLEYIDNIEEVIKEIIRVAGNLENIFVVTVSKYCLEAYFYKSETDSSKNLIKAPPKYKEFTYQKIKK